MSAILCNYNHSERSSRFILPLPVGSQSHLISPNHSHMDNVVFDRRKVVCSRRPSEAFPHPVAFWLQKDSSSAHCQVLAILQLKGERSSKVLRYRRALQRGWHRHALQSEPECTPKSRFGSGQSRRRRLISPPWPAPPGHRKILPRVQPGRQRLTPRRAGPAESPVASRSFFVPFSSHEYRPRPHPLLRYAP